MTSARAFAPYDDIARDLLPHALGDAQDGAHDLSHLLRVWRTVRLIADREGGDGAVLAAATLLHDSVDIPKDSPQRASASRLAAQRATALLTDLGWPPDQIDSVAHAIEAHSFSAQIKPRTLEARILQDADRLDALGHIGIARCFSVSGQLGRALYDPADPAAKDRALDDLAYALDHFQTKLLTLSGTFLTATGQALAADRHATVQAFLDGFLAEVSGPLPPA